MRPENGDALFTTELNLLQGMSKVSFPFWFDSPPTPTTVATTKKKDKSKVAAKVDKPSPAEDGRYYPGPGKYVLTIKADQKEVSTTFIIEARKK